MEMNATSRSAEDQHVNYNPSLENRNEEMPSFQQNRDEEMPSFQQNRDEEIAQKHTGEDEIEWKSPPVVHKETWAEFRKEMKLFLWNPETRQFMGRTAQSWSRILLYYTAFYTFLGGLFAGYLHVLLINLSPYTPKYRDRVAPPGVMIRPYVDSGFEIHFTTTDPNSWQPYVKNLEQFLEAYDDSVQERRNAVCTPGHYFIQDTGESTMKRACQFKRSTLKNCSGLEDKTFGYSGGQPCILLKMNRIIGYRPGYGTPVTVECNPQKGNENDIQAVDFYPSTTFDPMYFPYYGKLTHENYTSPLVAMQFTLRKNRTITIQCQLNGVGIINNMHNDQFLGRIIFELDVND